MIVRCPSCGKPNRSPAERLADAGVCGACRTPISPIAKPIAADPELFKEIAEKARVPVLVDFWADWCGPCHRAAPEVERTATEMAGRALVVKVDTDAHPELAAKYGVRGIPNFIVLKNGQLVFQQAGAVGSAEMKNWLVKAGAAAS